MPPPQDNPTHHQPPTVDPNCIFCKIIAGKIPSYKLYEDDQVYCFLDIGPLSHGHCLVIPKAHYTTIDQMPAQLTGACAAVLPALSQAVVAATGIQAWNILQNNGAIAGQVVNHVHFHLIPRHDGDNLGFRWPAGKLAPDKAQQLVATITAQLKA